MVIEKIYQSRIPGFYNVVTDIVVIISVLVLLQLKLLVKFFGCLHRIRLTNFITFELSFSIRVIDCEKDFLEKLVDLRIGLALLVFENPTVGLFANIYLNVKGLSVDLVSVGAFKGPIHVSQLFKIRTQPILNDMTHRTFIIKTSKSRSLQLVNGTFVLVLVPFTLL